MAGDWIKFEVGTPDKPEVWAIAGVLGIDPDAVVGKLLRVWAWFDQHTENGNAPSVSKMLLDRMVGVTGFCKAVIDAGWMRESDDRIALTEFERHNGQTAKNRALTAKRVANHKAKGNANANGKVTQTPLPKEDIDKDKKNKQPASEPFDFSSWPAKPADQILTDWFAMRKRIKADVSQTVINQFGAQMQIAAAAGVSVDHCLAECITSNWRGFKFQWIKNQEQSNAASQSANRQPFVKLSKSDQNDEATRRFLAERQAERGDVDCVVEYETGVFAGGQH